MTRSNPDWMLVILAILTLCCSNAQCNNKSDQSSATVAINLTEIVTEASLPASSSLNKTRDARVMKVLADPKVLAMKRHRGAASKLMSRADHLPRNVAAPSPLLHGRMPAVPYRRGPPPPPQFLMKSHPALVRRVQNAMVGAPSVAPPPHARFVAFDGGKGVRYMPSKGPVPFNAGKVGAFRPPYGAAQPQLPMHPNALTPSTMSPAQHQQYQSQQQQQQQQQQLQQQHQLQQQQQQQQQYQLQQQHQHNYHDSFKASPPFNGQAIVRPLQTTPDPLKHYTSHSAQQSPVQQHPIPLQKPAKLQQQQLLKYPMLQQSQNASPTQSSSKTPIFHYETMRPHEEPVLQPHVKHEHGLPGLGGYAVYENNELSEELSAAQRAQIYYQQYPALDEVLHQSGHESAAVHAAQEYLQFMATNDYFLPKLEPNYRQQDVEQNLQQHYSTQQQYHSPAVQQQQHLKYVETVRDNTGAASVSNAANYLNQPIEVSQLFNQENPAPSIVRGSYQAGNNLFVVNSDGKKAVKHVVSGAGPTTSAPTYGAHYGSNEGARHRTPEPVRFEFTERDAVPTSYTHSPLGQEQTHLRYKAAGVVVATSTPPLPTESGASASSSISNGATTLGTASGAGGGSYNIIAADDPEDNEDVHSGSSDRDSFGRVPIRQSTMGAFTTSPAPVEQKDTEDYCERICANVQDDDEEIVCGSDGYMYTSEAQMECYASCLHIDVTIQSKGSCNAT